MRKPIGAILFFVALFVAIAVVSSALTPTFGNGAKNSVQDLYEQPQNSVNVMFFGASTVRRAIAPDYLYEEFGISSFNRGTDHQQPMGSYYLLKEALKTQSESISVVFLDAAPLVKPSGMAGSSVPSVRIETNMRPSLAKFEFICAMAQEFSDIHVVTELFPLLKYHSRWNGDRVSNDRAAASEPAFLPGTHGQCVVGTAFESNASRGRAGKFSVESNNVKITESRDWSGERLRARWDDTNMRYCNMLVDLCREHGIQLVLLKTPDAEWGDFEHDSATLMAEELGIQFVDMSTPAVIAECGLSYDTDYYDGHHPNFLGSEKVSRFIGEYLRQSFDLPVADANGSSGFSAEDLDMFHIAREDAQLGICENLSDYASLIDKDRYAVFLATRGKTQSVMGKQERQQLIGLGFSRLKGLKNGQSYAGAVVNGESSAQERSDEGTAVWVEGARVGNAVLFGDVSMQRGAAFANPIVATSTGKGKEAEASVMFSDKEFSKNSPGVNIVVYDQATGFVVDACCFGSEGKGKRTSVALKASEQPGSETDVEAS